MCGIVGYTGHGKAQKFIVEGLISMEYRGYDSAGIAIQMNGKLEIAKVLGGGKELNELIEKNGFEGTTAIGHTRWATHGKPSVVNAHPHISATGKIAVVHNGIIENYQEIKDSLMAKGIEFVSETDTEVIAQLIGDLYEGDLKKAIEEAVSKMRGAYAIGVICDDEPDKLIAVRKDAPLVVGLGKGENFIASDIPAFLKYTRDAYLIENDEMVIMTPDSVIIYDKDNNVIDREIYHITWDVTSAEKGGYEHFMLKEIFEQPKVIDETLHARINQDGTINLDGITMTKEDIENFSRIYIVACGTAYHAGLVGKYAIEKMAKIPVEIDVASEFRYRDPYIDDKTLFIAISQSGETLDTLAALRLAKSKGARVLSVVNVVGSSVARESDDVFYTWAGPEIAVASTKAYTTQLVCMYLIAMYMGLAKGTIDKAYFDKILNELQNMSPKIQKILNNQEILSKLADEFYKKEKIFFIGRGLDAAVSYEGSLKLKEISYINSQAIAAGELKHGTIALMDEDTLIVAIATQDALLEKMVSNVEEINARGAKVVAIAKEGSDDIEKNADQIVYVPYCIDELAPLVSIVPLQLFAYYIAKNRGCNIDKPKNLAKSVTVE